MFDEVAWLDWAHDLFEAWIHGPEGAALRQSDTVVRNDLAELAPDERLIHTVCPEGSGPGSTHQITVEGHNFNVTVPSNVYAKEPFEVRLRLPLLGRKSFNPDFKKYFNAFEKHPGVQQALLDIVLEPFAEIDEITGGETGDGWRVGGGVSSLRTRPPRVDPRYRRPTDDRPTIDRRSTDDRPTIDRPTGASRAASGARRCGARLRRARPAPSTSPRARSRARAYIAPRGRAAPCPAAPPSSARRPSARARAAAAAARARAAASRGRRRRRRHCRRRWRRRPHRRPPHHVSSRSPRRATAARRR